MCKRRCGLASSVELAVRQVSVLLDAVLAREEVAAQANHYPSQLFVMCALRGTVEPGSTHLRIINSFLSIATILSFDLSMNLYSSAVSLPSASGR